VDTRVGRLAISSAGHCPLLLRDAAGKVEMISGEGMPLGIMEDATFAEEIVPLAPNGCALLYTDGLTEARNGSGELFGVERLHSWLSRQSQQKLTAIELSEGIQDELNRFQSNVTPADDQTFLILAPQVRESEASKAVPLYVGKPTFGTCQI